MKHTKGPWTYSDFNKIINDDGIIITELSCDRRLSLDEMNANSNLIAAAPELLDALTELLKDYTETDFDVCGLDLELIAKVKSTIKKATGVQVSDTTKMP